MDSKICTPLNSWIPSSTNVEQQEKDVSQVFGRIRTHLQAKEKELLELQRANSSLLAPDSHQIESLLDLIGSLHLSTQDGQFAFASATPSEPSTTPLVRPSGVDSIKVWPSTVWLPPSSTAEELERRLPMVTHLLSLPAKAFVSSSASTPPAISPPPTVVKVDDAPSNRLPMVNQLLSMPISAFIESSSTRTVASDTNNSNTVPSSNKVNVAESTSSSILQTNSVYSKDYWLRKSSAPNKDAPSTDASEVVPMDLEAHIEECSLKMRRLHAEYLAVLEKLGSL